ncbi:MAG: ATP phosphoribosyltransferase regulatory subunit [Eubacteriales bacterium]|nr:ATP phosphoribosyltransferase regulatory subunit [Eubacteriales bacterium]
MEQRSEARREQLMGRLRNVYESLGYTRFSMRRFEEYALYLENKSFLKSESVLTFTNPDGKLMALKPDVTLSIVKHARRERRGVEKVYYKESVYRLASTGGEFVEIDQMGVEALGAIDRYTVGEVVRLAIESLRAVGGAYVLDISHMGFVSGLMEAAGLTPEKKERFFDLIRRKSAHELAAAVAAENVSQPYAGYIVMLAELSGAFPAVLARAQAIAVCDGMRNALCELAALYDLLSSVGLSDCLQLDFSMINDLDYYNGIVFQGYVQGAPRVVLSGGRYDHLMRRFDKEGDGIGFALYLDELTRVLADKPAWDADVLALYRETDDPAKVNAAVFALAAQGLRILAASERPADVKAEKTMVFTGETFEEGTRDA